MAAKAGAKGGTFSGWVFNTSARRLAAVLFVTAGLTLLLAFAVAKFAQVQVAYGNWGLLVFIQFAFQFGAAALGDFASGDEDDSQASALATLTLATGALVGLGVLLVQLALSGSLADSPQVRASLLGAMLCEANQDTCVGTFQNIGWLVVACLLVSSFFSALMLRRQFQPTDKAVSVWKLVGLGLLAATAFSFSFLMLHEWRGVVTPSDPTGSDLGSGVSAVGLIVTNRLSLYISVSLAAFAIMLMNAYAFAILMRHGFKGLWSWALLPEDARDRLKAFLLFWVWLAIDVLTLIFVLLTLYWLVLALAFGLAFALDAVWAVLSAILGASRGAVSYAPQAVRATLSCASYIAPVIAAMAALSFVVVLLWRGRQVTASLLHCLFIGAPRAVAVGIWGATWGHPRVASLVLTGVAISAILLWPSGAPLVPYWERPGWVDGVSLPEGPVVSSPITQRFEPVNLDCSDGVEGGRAHWAYGSLDQLAFDLRSCHLAAPFDPATIFVFGAASRDDSRQGGFERSVGRGELLAEVVRLQFPEAEVVIVAMGRKNGENFPGSPEQDFYSFDRRVIMLASPQRLASPVSRPDHTETIASLMNLRGLRSDFDACALFVPSEDRRDRTYPTPRATDCYWAEPSD
tara:strand:+ start:9559 stop:11454 length:1896 start_codon:yes stop_codon:yes gene_type:complete